jgi:release factor glutamine methyltransferase
MTQTRMTRRAALDEAARSLAAAGVVEPRRESRLLAEHALALTREDLLLRPDAPLAAADAARLGAFVTRRVGREPFAYVTGQREFWSLDFTVDRSTLVPRPDSETVVEAVLANRSRLPERPVILDLGTGSGCLLVALLKELPDAIGVGVDCSAAALSVARRNARSHGVGGRAWFVAADWGASLAARFDLVVCNPPYIRSDDIESLAPEVSRYEPRTALSGGVDGLRSYRRVAPDIARLLTPKGLVAVELGAGMGDDVAALFGASGLCEIGRRRDLAGCERCALFAF